MLGKKTLGRKRISPMMKTMKVAARYAAKGLKMPRMAKKPIVKTRMK